LWEFGKHRQAVAVSQDLFRSGGGDFEIALRAGQVEIGTFVQKYIAKHKLFGVDLAGLPGVLAGDAGTVVVHGEGIVEYR